MTSAEIRQSFLQFFQEKEHTIVPSASLLPQSPGLLFTNAGMNQFVPYFLGTERAPFSPARAADTQKCIRAGGKHNDLEDVGYDTYHHTFFEMLGNWSFGEYFKKEAIEWSWELLTKVWKFPPHRLYATVYAPSEGDPSTFDQESYLLWKNLFEQAGLDPAVHIVNGNVKDNFWMMGETGPCGPCSELHMDITPEGQTGGALVNADSDQCIEIWNLVFIEYNAEADGTFRDLPAKHVDTGMGFERVCSILQNTRGLTDFSTRISNYATDVFSPLFEAIAELSTKSYYDLYWNDSKQEAGEEQETRLKEATAFRVIADHLRTLSLSIADGIQPGNTGRNYVLRRILRRAVKYGRTLGFSGQTPFLSQLVAPLVAQLGEVFPELAEKEALIKTTLDREEQSFNETLDRGLRLFEEAAKKADPQFPAEEAFKLYDTYGFPLDLTALLCRERDLTLDENAVHSLMEAQRKRARSAQKTALVRAVDIQTEAASAFVGFAQGEVHTTVLEVHQRAEGDVIITASTPFYVEKGGQVGDAGSLTSLGGHYEVLSTIQVGEAVGHLIAAGSQVTSGQGVTLRIDQERRQSISAHHTATHLLHWALRQEMGPETSQQGSMVQAERLRFDFNATALSAAQLDSIEDTVNARIAENAAVSWVEVPHKQIENRPDIVQFFGDKYGSLVRVVQIGGAPQDLNGYSMELCGGTHVKQTGELGLFVIKKEEAVASGVRRIEALCGPAALSYQAEEQKRHVEELQEVAQKRARLWDTLHDLNKELSPLSPVLSEGTLTEVKARLVSLKNEVSTLEKQWKKSQATQAAQIARTLLEPLLSSSQPIVLCVEGDTPLVQEFLQLSQQRQLPGAAFFIVKSPEKLLLAAHCGQQAREAGLRAGELVRELSALVNGKGGGKADQARGAAPEVHRAEDLERAARQKLQTAP